MFSSRTFFRAASILFLSSTQTEQLCYPHEFEPLAGKAEMAHTHVTVLKRQEGLEKILGRVFDGKDGDGGGIPEDVERMPACGQQLDLFRIEDVQGDLYVIVELRYRDAGPHVELMGLSPRHTWPAS